MSLTAYFFSVAAALVTLVVVVDLLRRRRLRERHAIWWLVAGIMALVVSLVPTVLTWAAVLVGVEVPINLVFFVSLAVLFLVCIQHSVELTALESKTRALAERVALLELEVRDDAPPADAADSPRTPE
ncbi:DUF2304 domain-containing protein [Protaetiibacter mangrovi]|uniref:DUF2304 domain-containing protein n=1 Tax=Protaetiibacter mangrovi TaxID=2970926 RepID=A0ABT1ZFJ8_9MICO|nr:DUF2304 domain-containing protein [Protaetiibacter mangrovi]MCS0499467.1 DUF2304 domain-containing protein [Protaetiibacter mangrovi]TPX02796.1 DUF2304 domain-containing protein [Schumannella luteola]